MKSLRFTTSKWLDKKMTQTFLDERAAGIDFGEGIVHLHPALRVAKNNTVARNRIVDTYFNTYYRTHGAKMNQRVARVKEQWKKRELEYVIVTERYFGGFKFSSGMYVAYASIINCNPRFLDSKTFQFFYQKGVPDAIHTVAHELLHFIFFDFVKKKLPKLAISLPEEALWDVSEIFNVILLKSPRYQSLIDRRFVRPYPEHRKFISRAESLYKTSGSAKEFIIRLAQLISRQKQKGEK
ncbi:MAG: hypothetical protein Q7S89_00320 [bacterium]|nr:hypothetical protein [bacterium]